MPASPVPSSGSSTQPAWATVDHASSRTAPVWARATRLPIVIVATTSTANHGCHEAESPGRPMTSRIAAAARPATFDVVDRNAATGTGDPAYTSGTHRPNGSAATL